MGTYAQTSSGSIKCSGLLAVALVEEVEAGRIKSVTVTNGLIMDGCFVLSYQDTKHLYRGMRRVIERAVTEPGTWNNLQNLLGFAATTRKAAQLFEWLMQNEEGAELVWG